MVGASTYGTAERRSGSTWRYEPLATQRRFHADLRTRFKGYSGPVNCVAGGTVIDGNEITIEQMADAGFAPVVQTLLGPMQAEVPFLKGIDDLYRVTLETGEAIIATKGHLFLGRQGWQELSAFSVGEQLLRYSLSHRRSTSDISQRTSRPNGKRSN